MKDSVIEADFRPHVVIATKHKVIDLVPDAVGTLVEEIFGDAVPRRISASFGRRRQRNAARLLSIAKML